jgi:cytochrome c-type biogenesis protein CcmH/NrfF
MHELSHDLMSPYCPGRTIASCPSPQARKLEAHILEQAESGKSREQIETSLVARFPDIRGYVGRPEILYGTALFALLAIIGLSLAARRWVRRTAAASVRRRSLAVRRVWPAARPDERGRSWRVAARKRRPRRRSRPHRRILSEPVGGGRWRRDHGGGRPGPSTRSRGP